jgi:hypothetical protein
MQHGNKLYDVQSSGHVVMSLAQLLLHDASERRCTSLSRRTCLIENAHISVKNILKLTIVTTWVGKNVPFQYFST